MTTLNSTIDISRQFNFSESSFSDLNDVSWVRKNWPVVYFIEQEKSKASKRKPEAYVGETTNFISRIKNHLQDPKRKNLDKISIIGCDTFNKSATLHIESKLIQYLFAEGSYQLQNGNNGASNHNYYQSAEYEALFKDIWGRLQEENIVSRSIEEIRNSDFYKYSPYKTLNPDQFRSVLEILGALNEQKRNQIFVEGSAGTGKTILATYLIKLISTSFDALNFEELDESGLEELSQIESFHSNFKEPKIALVVAMTSLRETLKKVFETIPGLSKNMVIGPSELVKQHYDILIVDEAHRLRCRKNISWMGTFDKTATTLGFGPESNELDWILARSDYQIFFYDSHQSVRPSDIPQKEFTALMNKPSTVHLKLKSQMRVSGGEDYINYIRRLLNCELADDDKFQSTEFDFYVYDSFAEMHDALLRKAKVHSLCRFVAGYAWDWKTKKDKSPDAFDIELDGIRLMWNATNNDWIGTSEFSALTADAPIQVGCIHTTQGYDLNYVAVIFGWEIDYNESTRQIEIDPDKYYDRFGKAGVASKEELKEYIVNIYKTLLYRGIKGAYIYACNESMRKYLIQATRGKKVSKDNIISFPSAQRMQNSVPFYEMDAAAGVFGEYQEEISQKWIELPANLSAREGLFACRVVGESMNRRIPNNSVCLFRANPDGSREGKIVLVQHRSISDPDTGGSFTVKQYHSEKLFSEDGTWQHSRIVLSPISSESRYEDIVLNEDEAVELKVLGEFVRVL